MNLLLKRILLVGLVLMVAVSCASKKTTTDEGEGSGDAYEGNYESSGDSSLEINGDSDSSKAGNLRTIYFAYDSAALSRASKNVLDQNAEFLKSNESVSIQVEGHCDERGGIEYNLALGERRAKSVRNYLTALGVSNARLSIVSYGKERPLSFGHEQESWAKNRRANFVITAK